MSDQFMVQVLSYEESDFDIHGIKGLEPTACLDAMTEEKFLPMP